MSEQGDISSIFSRHRRHIMGGNENEGDRLFSVVAIGRVKGNRCKLNHMKFHLSTGKIFYNIKSSNTGRGCPEK